MATSQKPKPDTKPFLSNTLIANLVFCVGAVIILIGTYKLLLAHQSKSWPTTEAVITRSSVFRAGGSSGQSYEPLVEYEYYIGERKYTSDRIGFGSYLTWGRSEAEGIADKYEVGEIVPAKVDPDDPERSVIEIGVHRNAWKIPLFGAILCVISTLLRVRLKQT